MGEDAAAEVGAKLLLDVLGKRALVRLPRVRQECFQVLADRAVEDRLGGTTG